MARRGEAGPRAQAPANGAAAAGEPEAARGPMSQ